MLNLLWVVAVLLVLMWALGFAFHVTGGFIHVLIVLAVVAVLFWIIAGRRVA